MLLNDLEPHFVYYKKINVLPSCANIIYSFELTELYSIKWHANNSLPGQTNICAKVSLEGCKHYYHPFKHKNPLVGSNPPKISCYDNVLKTSLNHYVIKFKTQIGEKWDYGKIESFL